MMDVSHGDTVEAHRFLPCECNRGKGPVGDRVVGDVPAIEQHGAEIQLIFRNAHDEIGKAALASAVPYHEAHVVEDSAALSLRPNLPQLKRAALPRSEPSAEGTIASPDRQAVRTRLKR